MARPIRDVGLGGRRESVAGVRCRYGFGETWQFALVKGSSVARNGSYRGLGGIVDERSCRERTKWPSEGLPKGGTHVLTVCLTVQLDDCVALALQQHRERSALRKRKG